MKENASRLLKTLLALGKRHAMTCTIIALALILFTHRFQLAVNFTESLPGTVFLIDKKVKTPQKGELVAFTWKDAAPIPDGVTVIKRVAGLAGDKIVNKNRVISVNDKPVGLAKTQAKTGEPLEAIASLSIPKGYFFAMGEHADSFDSRYVRPGLIAYNAIRGRAYRVW